MHYVTKRQLGGNGGIIRGDTRFIMWTIGALSLGVMIIPMYLLVEVFGGGLYMAWALATIYISALGIAFMWRYKQGSWKRMRVIEIQPIGFGGRGRCSLVVETGSGSYCGE